MKRINIVQCFDGFNSEAGWVPVYSCDSADEANSWVKDQEKKNGKYDVKGLHYRVRSCKYVAR